MNSTPRVLLVGKLAADAAREIADSLPQVEFAAVADVPAVLAWVDRQQQEPVVIVIAQSFPGEIPAADIIALSRRLPLSRIWPCLDPGVKENCERQTVAGGGAGLHPSVGGACPAGIVGAAPRAAGGLDSARHGRRRTAAAGGNHAVGGRRGTIAVWAANPATLAALDDACQSAGYWWWRSAKRQASLPESGRRLGWTSRGLAIRRPSPDYDTASERLRLSQSWDFRAPTTSPRQNPPALPRSFPNRFCWKICTAVCRGIRAGDAVESVPSPASARSVRRISRRHSAS